MKEIRRSGGDGRRASDTERVARGLMASVAMAGGAALCFAGGAALVVGPLLVAAGANGLYGTVTGRTALARLGQWNTRRRRDAGRAARRPKRPD